MNKTFELHGALNKAYEFAFTQWANSAPNSVESSKAREQLRLLEVALGLASDVLVEIV